MRKSFSKNKKRDLFNLLSPIDGEDSLQIRQDRKGRKVAKAAYGDRNSSFGWNIHHKDGNYNNNSIENLEALHYESHDEEHKN